MADCAPEGDNLPCIEASAVPLCTSARQDRADKMASHYQLLEPPPETACEAPESCAQIGFADFMSKVIGDMVPPGETIGAIGFAQYLWRSALSSDGTIILAIPRSRELWCKKVLARGRRF